MAAGTAGHRLPPPLMRRRINRVLGPVQRFLHVEAAGGIVLLVATAVALVWANGPFGDSYAEVWGTHITITFGDLLTLDEDLTHWVNDALMVLFFFVVGLEIKRELVAGELRDPRTAAVPAVAAVGGMAVPALLYTAFNAGGPGADGWGVPMATDIAFALGVVALLGSRVPASLKVFLLSLAIVDDIGAIAVIAIFYTDDLSVGWLLWAVAGLVVMHGMKRAHVWYIPAYVAVGVFVWLATLESGVHATIAGVAMGLLAPARPLQSREEAEAVVAGLGPRPSVADVRAAAFAVRESVSVAERLMDALHPWTSYVVIPVFALANAGVRLTGDTIADAAGSAVTLGVIVGLVVGKTVGITGAVWLAVATGLGRLPLGSTWPQVVGVAMVAGIGFTVSLFIAALGFDDPALGDQAKVGILAASAVAAVGGLGILAAGSRTRSGSA